MELLAEPESPLSHGEVALIWSYLIFFVFYNYLAYLWISKTDIQERLKGGWLVLPRNDSSMQTLHVFISIQLIVKGLAVLHQAWSLYWGHDLFKYDTIYAVLTGVHICLFLVTIGLLIAASWSYIHLSRFNASPQRLLEFNSIFRRGVVPLVGLALIAIPQVLILRVATEASKLNPPGAFRIYPILNAVYDWITVFSFVFVLCWLFQMRKCKRELAALVEEAGGRVESDVSQPYVTRMFTLLWWGYFVSYIVIFVYFVHLRLEAFIRLYSWFWAVKVVEDAATVGLYLVWWYCFKPAPEGVTGNGSYVQLPQEEDMSSTQMAAP